MDHLLLSDAAVERPDWSARRKETRSDNSDARGMAKIVSCTVGVPAHQSPRLQTCSSRNGYSRRKEQGNYIVAVPLVSGDRMLGVIEGVREGKDSRSFRKSEIAYGRALLPLASALANAVRIAEAERSHNRRLAKLHNARYMRQFL